MPQSREPVSRKARYNSSDADHLCGNIREGHAEHIEEHRGKAEDDGAGTTKGATVRNVKMTEVIPTNRMPRMFSHVVVAITATPMNHRSRGVRAPLRYAR